MIVISIFERFLSEDLIQLLSNSFWETPINLSAVIFKICSHIKFNDAKFWPSIWAFLLPKNNSIYWALAHMCYGLAFTKA